MKLKRKTFLWGIGGILLVAIIATAGIRTWLKDPVPSGAPTPTPQGEGWVNLLDETHAKDWENITDDKEIFEIADGVLHIFGRTIYPLRYAGYTAQPFSNFDLHLEFRLDDGANSGVFLRVQRDDPVRRGWEVQVLEDYGSAPNKNGCGAIYDVVTPMFNMSRPAGEWNSFDISVHGQEVMVFVNGWRVVHTDFDKMTTPIGKFDTPFAELPKEGLLALQDHGGEVWYRNIFIRPAE